MFPVSIKSSILKTGVSDSQHIRNDLDTTSIGLTVSDHVDEATKHKVMNQMLEYQNSDGIVQVYFDHGRPRIGTRYLSVIRR